MRTLKIYNLCNFKIYSMLLFLGSSCYVVDPVKLCLPQTNAARILFRYSSLLPVWQHLRGLSAFRIKGKAKHMSKTKLYLWPLVSIWSSQAPMRCWWGHYRWQSPIQGTLSMTGSAAQPTVIPERFWCCFEVLPRQDLLFQQAFKGSCLPLSWEDCV